MSGLRLILSKLVADTFAQILIWCAVYIKLYLPIWLPYGSGRLDPRVIFVWWPVGSTILEMHFCLLCKKIAFVFKIKHFLFYFVVHFAYFSRMFTRLYIVELTTRMMLTPYFDNSASGVIISWSGRVSILLVIGLIGSGQKFGGSGRVDPWTSLDCHTSASLQALRKPIHIGRQCWFQHNAIGTENVNYEVSESSIKDKSMLGAHGQKLCENIDVHWMTPSSANDSTDRECSQCLCIIFIQTLIRTHAFRFISR